MLGKKRATKKKKKKIDRRSTPAQVIPQLQTMLPCRAAIRPFYSIGSTALPYRYTRHAVSFSKARTLSRFSASQNSIPAFSYVQPQAGPDTIFALSTAPGKAGVAVIRISGRNAKEVSEERHATVLLTDDFNSNFLLGSVEND